MAAPKNNKFWEFRSKHGRDKLFASAKILWDEACAYFKWCEDNPLYESKAFAFQGEITMATLPKMRALTMSGLCFYLGCNEAYFRQFKASLPEDEQDFSTVIGQIEQTIYNQKFQGAAADLLNANIIARELGLRDNMGLTDGDGKPLQTSPTAIVVVSGATIEIPEQE